MLLLSYCFFSLLFSRSSLLLSCLSSFVFTCLFSPLSSSLVFSRPSSSIFSFLLFSFIFSCLFSSLLFHLLVSSLSLSVSVWCCVVCVVVVVVLLLVVVCVCVCCGTLKKREKSPCVDSQTPPCVHAKRPHVCRHHAHMCFNMCAWCRYTRGRFESTHGGRFVHTYGSRGSSLVVLTKIGPRLVITCFREVHQRNPWIFTIFSLRIGREQHVVDSSKVSVYAHMYMFMTFHNGFMSFWQSSLRNIHIKTCHHESSRTQQHSDWNCVVTNRPQHKHMYGHIV